MTKIRCSTLPRFMACSNSVTNPDEVLPVEWMNEAAELGTLIHSLAESYVKTGEYDLQGLKGRITPADYTRASDLMANLKDFWNQASGAMGENVETERYIEANTGSMVLTGHIDLSSIIPNKSGTVNAFGVDYKTGRIVDNHYHQVAGYAYLLWSAAGRPKKFKCYFTIVYLEDLSKFRYIFDTARLKSWEEEVNAQLEDGRYTINRHCAYCPIRSGCPAVEQVTTHALSVFGKKLVTDMRKMSNEDRAEVFLKVKIAESELTRFKMMLKGDVKARGPLDTGDGRVYSMDSRNYRVTNLSKALPVLDDHLGDDMWSCMSFNYTDAADLVYSKAKRGGKGKAREAFIELLEKCGGLKIVTKAHLMCKKKVEVKEDE